MAWCGADQPIRFERGTQRDTQRRPVIATRMAVRPWCGFVGAARAPSTARPGRRRVCRFLANSCWICRSETCPGKLDCRSWIQSRPTTGLVGFWELPTYSASKMRCLSVIEGKPTPDAVWRELLAAFLQPIESNPQRPRQLEVPRPEFRRAWRQLLKELNIECRVIYKPQPVSQLLEAMADVVAAQRLPRLDDNFDARDLPLGDATWANRLLSPAGHGHERKASAVQRPWSVLVMDKASDSCVVYRNDSGRTGR